MNDSLQATLKYLYDLQFFGVKLGLNHTSVLLNHLGNPHLSFPVIHVAGTNGKGSTCAMLDSIFRAAGYKTGLYTSPHLFHFSERIRINGVAIPEAEIVRLTNVMKNKIDELKCTFFEATTAMAFDYFKDNRIEIGIIETGLGGRLDSTNTVDPLISVITNIGLEHTEYLGKTIESIAREKAGIIKKNKPCLIGYVNDQARRVFQETAVSLQSADYFLEDIANISNSLFSIDHSQMDLKVRIGNELNSFDALKVGLAGKHQLNNAALAVSSLLIQKKFQVSENAIRQGLENVTWNARLEIIQKEPYVVADAAHNAAGMKVLSEAITSIYKPRFNKLYLIIGMLADKDYEEAVASIAADFTEIYTITPKSERALDAEKLAECLHNIHSKVKTAESLELAIREIKSKMTSRDMLLVTGSHFVLSELNSIRQVS